MFSKGNQINTFACPPIPKIKITKIQLLKKLTGHVSYTGVVSLDTHMHFSTQGIRFQKITVLYSFLIFKLKNSVREDGELLGVSKLIACRKIV